MSPATPSAAELMRRLDDLTARLDRVVSSLEAGYVRKDVYDANRTADALQVKAAEDDLHAMTKRIDGITEQRDRERDERDKQRSADRRLLYTLAVSVFIGPVFVAWILHALGGQ